MLFECFPPKRTSHALGSFCSKESNVMMKLFFTLLFIMVATSAEEAWGTWVSWEQANSWNFMPLPFKLKLTGWPTLNLPMLRTNVMDWHTLICTPCVIFWSIWRDRSQRPKTSGFSPHIATAGWSRGGVPVRAQHQQYGRFQKPWYRPKTLQWTLASKGIWIKGLTAWLTRSHYSFHDEILSPARHFLSLFSWILSERVSCKGRR